MIKAKIRVYHFPMAVP